MFHGQLEGTGFENLDLRFAACIIGHARVARLQRATRRARAANPLWRLLLTFNDGLLGITLGYGRRPLLSFA